MPRPFLTHCKKCGSERKTYTRATPPFAQYTVCPLCARQYAKAHKRERKGKPALAQGVCVECGGVRDQGTIFGVRCEPCGRVHRAKRETAKYHADVEKARAKDRLKYARDPQKSRARAAKWREANPEFFKALQREESAQRRKDAAYREQQSALYTVWAQKKRDVLRAYHERWRIANPEKWTAIIESRRAREAQAEGVVTGDELKAILEQQNGRCYDCDVELLRPSLGHGVPLNRGGTHWPHNLIYQCKSCNSSQHDRVHPDFQHLYDEAADKSGKPLKIWKRRRPAEFR